ncbi:MAG: sigma 54-interacting transcriptional regulator, partial [Bacillota bacterium]|nr:sigma 54-interacting transcriptional regulator [Bacillota bacterium]
MYIQVKLLRALQEKSFYRVGGSRLIHSDVRIIAASNQDLRKSSVNGLFRTDLFYRLNVLNLKLPPLRERKEDIIHLYRHFLRLMKVNVNNIETILDPDFSQALSDYSWPGNVRELEHFAEKTAALSRMPSVSLKSVKNNL